MYTIVLGLSVYTCLYTCMNLASTYIYAYVWRPMYKVIEKDEAVLHVCSLSTSLRALESCGLI